MKNYYRIPLLSIIALSSFVKADINSGISMESQKNLDIGVSTVHVPGIYSLGRVGVSFNNNIKFADFASLARNSNFNGYFYTIIDESKDTKFVFSNISGQDIWFGEWSSPNEERLVFYAGDDKSTSMPSSGKGQYIISGINNEYLLVGELTTDFSSQVTRGVFANGKIKVELFSNKLHKDTKEIIGGVIINDTKYGIFKGHFFGENSKFLAGFIRSFDNRDLDLSFVGEKG